MRILRATYCLLLAICAAELAKAQNQRPFRLAATASQAVPGQVPLYEQNTASFPISALGADVEMISVFPEHLGFPVDLFLLAETPAPAHPWTLRMLNLAAQAKATGKPLLVQLALSREYMTSKAYESGGQLRMDPAWAPKCLDFSTPIGSLIGTAYVRYVRWITTVFAPEQLVVMAEANRYYADCGRGTAGWNAFVNIERAAYDAAKAVNSGLVVYPSFHLETLYGNSATGFDMEQYNAMSNLKRDRFGVSAYPAGVSTNPFLLPPDYLSRVRNRNPQEKRFVVTETGWNSTSLALLYQGSCLPQVPYSETSFAAAYLLHALYYAYIYDYEVVTWWSARDLLPAAVMGTCYPNLPPGSASCAGNAWCLTMAQYRADYAPLFSPLMAEFVFKVFGTMGLRSYDGTEKPELMSWWNLFRAMPIRMGQSAAGRLPAPSLPAKP